jgi:tRNA dimethylallyltransferase
MGRVLVLFGPTASGKTELLLHLFGKSSTARLKTQKRFLDAPGAQKAEVISADSMQVYKGLDIGTAKPSPAERAVLPHHLIDILDPSCQWTAGDFVRIADEAAREISDRGALPVVSGGTGFYLKNFVDGLPEAPPSNAEIRAALKTELAGRGAAALFAEMAASDPVSASRIHPNDHYRILRALEVFRLAGKPLSAFERSSAASREARAREYQFIILGLDMERERLYAKTNKRVEEMFNAGLAEEVKSLFEKNINPDMPAMNAIGYKEFFVWDGAWRLNDDIDIVKEKIKQNTRNYAKRQLTFFRKFSKDADAAGLPIRWFSAGLSDHTNSIKEIEAFISSSDNPI